MFLLSVLVACGLTPCMSFATDDFDGNGYVDQRDYRLFAPCLSLSGPGGDPGYQECRDVFDADADGDVDLADYAAFQRAVGHLPIPLRDTRGDVLTVNSTGPYSGRQTCGGCHDVDTIANGLHSQEGRTDADGNVVVQEDYLGDGRWWIRAGGKYGKWRPSTNRQLASKLNPHESRIDYGSFGWIASCSGCHAGGGQGEFDRDHQRYYDVTTGQWGFEALGKTLEEVALDGDYFYHNAGASGATLTLAPWDQTGLSEPDCLLCHRADGTRTTTVVASRSRRASVIASKTNLVDDKALPVPAFAAAATAGQGWFSNIDLNPDVGPRVLQIDYSVGVADGSLVENPDGTVSLPRTSLQELPTDMVCFGCHQGGAQNKRGATWFDDRIVHFQGLNKLRDDDPTNDIPKEKSTTCNFCHPGGLHHNFAKGNAMSLWFRDELDWVNMRSCRDCHLWDSPVRHPDAPDVQGGTDTVEVHLTGTMMEKLSCQACHIPYALLEARCLADHSLTGKGKGYNTDAFYSADPLNPSDPDTSRWYPAIAMKQDSDGEYRYFPYNRRVVTWWADWEDPNGTPEDYSDDLVVPIIPWRVQQIVGGEGLPAATDDNGDGKAEVNRPEEILAYIQALRGNDSYGRQVGANPVLVKGRKLWYEDPAEPGVIKTFEYEGTGIIAELATRYEMDHNILPKEQAWGYNAENPEEGCRDCHRPDTFDSPVFDRLILVDPWDPDGQPVYETVRERTGLSPP
jgi:hypothetical protein